MNTTQTDTLGYLKMNNWDGIERRHGVSDLSEIKDSIREIKVLLHGNGKIGISEMARRSFEYMTMMKSTKNGLMDWTFRAIIVIVLGYISVKVGLK